MRQSRSVVLLNKDTNLRPHFPADSSTPASTTHPLTSRHFLFTPVSVRLPFAMSYRFLWLPFTRGMLDNLIGAFYSLSKRHSVLGFLAATLPGSSRVFPSACLLLFTSCRQSVALLSLLWLRCHHREISARCFGYSEVKLWVTGLDQGLYV